MLISMFVDNLGFVKSERMRAVMMLMVVMLMLLTIATLSGFAAGACAEVESAAAGM